MLRAAWTVFVYELQRCLTPGRAILWCMMASIPPLLVGTIMWQVNETIPTLQLSLISYALVPQVACMLGLLLWATPAIQSEMESQTWVYMTLRPDGKLGTLIGKYFVAVVWTCTAGWVSSIALGLLAPEKGMLLAWTLMRLVMLSSLAYGALYLLIGVLILRRSTIVALAYSLIIEFVVSFIPATVNQLTISYRLRGLLVKWMDLKDLRSASEFVFGSETVSTHLIWMGCIVCGMLLAALWSVRFREIPMETEF